MTIIEAAKAAGWPVFLLAMLDGTEDLKRLERFAQIIRNQALEDAANVCEARQTPGTGSVAILNGAINAIRAMKEQQ